jgi:predicted nucleotidyltransferase
MSLAEIQITPFQLKQFCRNNHIRKLAFFGSVVRHDFNLQSDIDVLVEFEPGKAPGFDFFTIEQELSSLLGRKVDLQTANFISPEIRVSIESELLIAYEQTRS